MINGFELSKNYIQFIDKIETWQEAIKLSAEPLLTNGDIEKSYIEAMIKSVTEHGPYIVIAPMIALPHARPEAGANKMAFSVLKLNEPVYFTEDKDENYKASLLITLSCVDSDSHLQMLQALVSILSDEVKNKAIFDASSVGEILSILSI